MVTDDLATVMAAEDFDAEAFDFGAFFWTHLYGEDYATDIENLIEAEKAEDEEVSDGANTVAQLEDVDDDEELTDEEKKRFRGWPIEAFAWMQRNCPRDWEGLMDDQSTGPIPGTVSNQPV